MRTPPVQVCPFFLFSALSLLHPPIRAVVTNLQQEELLITYKRETRPLLPHLSSGIIA